MHATPCARSVSSGMAGRPAISAGERKRHALALFAGLPRHYDRVGAVLSFGQDPRLRRAMIGRVGARGEDRVLVGARGPGMVAGGLGRGYGGSVVGLAQSEAMLGVARGGVRRDAALGRRVELVVGEAERLP